MKKIIALSLAVLTIFAAVGCGKGPADDKPAPVDKEKDAQTQKNGAAPAQAKD